jgi:hypothetical protein
MSKYKTLRMWSLFLMVIGVVSIVSAAFGVIAWAIAVEGGWETLAVIFFGAPIALILAAWPLALGEALRALADIGDSLSVPEFAASPTGF